MKRLLPSRQAAKGTASPVGIIGAGAWGTALAHHLAGCGQQVLLWAYEKETMQDINRQHENTQFLPGITLPSSVVATTNLDELVSRCQVLLYAGPAQVMTEIATVVGPTLRPEQILVICAKGLRETDGALLSEVWHEAAPSFKNLAVLTGPTFAMEIAQGKTAAILLAAADDSIIQQVDSLFTSTQIRLYYSNDMIGAQVGGALKNVLAIGAGINDGLQMGANLKAAIMCRGVAEMMRYTRFLGGDEHTLAGLAGMGDLMLTASSPQSRNYRFGLYLGEGLDVGAALKKVGATVEGLHTARIATVQATARGIDLGIVMAIDGILSGDIEAGKALHFLLNRPRIREFGNNGH